MPIECNFNNKIIRIHSKIDFDNELSLSYVFAIIYSLKVYTIKMNYI